MHYSQHIHSFNQEKNSCEKFPKTILKLKWGKESLNRFTYNSNSAFLFPENCNETPKELHQYLFQNFIWPQAKY